MTIEKIIEIKKALEDAGVINESNDAKFLEVFTELKKWFKWDIQRFPYKEVTDEAGEFYNYKESDIEFYKDNYDLVVFSVMVGLYSCREISEIIECVDAKLRSMFTPFNTLEDGNFYKNYKRICGINIDILGYFVRGMIRNKMGNSTFEEFLNNYAAILQKYKLTPFIDKDGTIETTATPVDESIINDDTIETTATPVVEPKYIPSSDGFMEQVKAKYAYVPAAYLALQCNPAGLWYMYQQTGQCRSQFVDYSELDKSRDNMALNHIEAITKLMTKRTVYQMILQEMPELGTKINGNTIKFKIAGYSATKIGLLAVKDDEHVLAIIYDNAEDKAQGISGDKKNVDAWTAKKLAD